ncbi:MAG: hypothetical protein WCG06_01255, partial [Candidatus Omnitrophota bacterium]
MININNIAIKAIRKLILRIVAAPLCLAFLVSDAGFALEALGPTLLTTQSALMSVCDNPALLEIPQDAAVLKETYKGQKPVLVIHIQDPHSNYSGQRNLASALDAIMAKYEVSDVLVEGGFGDASLEAIRKQSSAEDCARTAKSLLLDGQISGEEYLNLTSDRPMRITGIENADLYAKGLVAYARLAKQREEILSYLNTISCAVEKLKIGLYSRPLLAYEKDSAASGGLNAGGLLELIHRAKIDLGQYPDLQKLERLRLAEKAIDFIAANLEQAALIQKIEKGGGAQALKASLQEFNRSKNSTAQQLALLLNLLKSAGQMRVPAGSIPNLLSYKDYLEQYAALEPDRLLLQMTRAEDVCYRALLGQKEALLLRGIDRYLGLLKTAYQIRMTADEFRLFAANESDFATPAYLSFLNRKLADAGAFDRMVPFKKCLDGGRAALTEFYDSVSERDLAFVDNARRLMDHSKVNRIRAVVLIAGGYH